MNEAIAAAPRGPAVPPRGYDSETLLDAKAEALARVAAATEAVCTVGARLRSNKILSKALKAWRRGDTPRTAQWALAATEADDGNAAAFHLLAIALEKLGYLHKALVTYEKAFSLDPDDTDLVLNLGLTAWNMNNLVGAERMFRLYIEKRPDHPAGYNNLGSVQRDCGNFQEAVETLRLAIYRMPDQPMLWNTLGTILAEEGRTEESLVFYQEALRLDPRYSRVWHNLGFAYAHLGNLEQALAAYDSALALQENTYEIAETRHSRAICLIGMGRLEEGFREYEIRNAPVFRAAIAHYTHAPLWNGENLAGKRVLVVGEQGVGDEIMFAATLPDLAKAVGDTGRLQIAVDRRLVPLFQRSFPGAEVGSHGDGLLGERPVRIFPWAREGGDPDFYLPMGTALLHLRKKTADFPRRAFLKADSARRAQLRARLETFGPGPYVGIGWRSMVLGSKRGKYFSALDAWKPILSTPGITFVNLQYGDVRDELRAATARMGVTVHDCADLDLKNDIDGAAALTEACDLVISAPTAVAALAGALGKEIWFLVSGRVWPQLGTDHYPWYRASRVFAPEKFADWDAVIPRLAAALAEFNPG